MQVHVMVLLLQIFLRRIQLFMLMYNLVVIVLFDLAISYFSFLSLIPLARYI